MYQAISTACLYPMETEKALKTLLDLGFKDFEVFINSQSEFTKEFFAELKNLLKPHNAKIYSVHLFTSGLEPYMFFSNYPRRYNDSLEQYKKYFAIASSIGAIDVTFHGDRKNSSLSIDEFCEHFLPLSEAAENEGIHLGQENVARCRSGKISEIKGMKERLGDKIHFVLDVKQALRAGEDPFLTADAMGKNICCVHMSDHTEEDDCLLPGKGNFDIAKFTKKLSFFGYNGPIITEVYSSCYKSLDEIVNAQNYLGGAICK